MKQQRTFCKSLIIHIIIENFNFIYIPFTIPILMTLQLLSFTVDKNDFNSFEAKIYKNN